MAKKILFINPPTPEKGVVVIRDLDRSGRKSMEKTIWPQTSLAYLAAVMKEEGYEVKIFDCIAEKIYWGEFEKKVAKEKPDYILTNVISSTLTNDIKVAKVAHDNNAVSIVVGPHVTALAKDSLKDFAEVDYVIMNEAEGTLPALIEALEKGEDLTKVLGVAFRKGGEIIVNEERPLVNLDELPIPLHELLPIDKYCLPYVGKRYTFLTTSRGCPFRCTFCRSPIVWKRRVRSRSVESILKELEKFRKLKIKNFLVHSDVFTINKKIAIDLCKEIVKRGWKFRWICNSRVNTVDEELLLWMKKAGCWMINYGIESGSQEILNNVNKQITLEEIDKAVHLAKKVGIKVWGYFIIGLPGETWETVDKTIRLAKKLPLDLVNFAVGAPYPGTEFFQLVKEKKWLKSSNWEEYDQNYSAIVSYPDMSNKDIKKAMKKAYKAWYFRPIAVWRLLKGIRSFNDLKVLFSATTTHLKWIFAKK